MGITNSQYDAIMRVYEKRRIDNHHVEEERREAAYQAIPELGQLDRAVASLSVRALKHSLGVTSGEDTDAGSMGQGNSAQMPSGAGSIEQDAFPQMPSGAGSIEQDGALQVSPATLGAYIRKAAGGMDPEKRRAQLLLAHSFPEDYLDPIYTCPDCKDTGWIGRRHCHCFEAEAVSLFYTQSGLSDILKKENFRTFDLGLYRRDLIDEKTQKSSLDIMTAAFHTCRRFTEGFGSEDASGYLLLTGPTGLGKTFLTHCIAKELIDKGRSVIYYSAGELFDELAEGRFGKDSGRDAEGFDDALYYNCDLLIIDDLGTEMTNTFVGSELFRILNTRIARRLGIVISTNLSLPEIGRIYSERILSRIMERFTLIRVFGEDNRVRKRLNRH